MTADVNVNDVLMGLLKAAGVEPRSPYEKAEVQVVREGKHIILPGEPKPMEIPDAISRLKQIQKDEEQNFDLHEVIEGHPYDALVAFNKAIKKVYGWASPIPTPGFFGPTPPSMISIPTGPRSTDVLQVPFGSFQLPSIDHPVHVGFGRGKRGYALHVQGTGKRIEKHFLLELCNVAREILRTDSIYRGKAVSAKSDGCGELQQELTFWDVSGTSKEEVILNAEVLAQVQVNLWTPVEKSAECRKHRIPLKRGVLLEGKYGTGKSLTARVTAAVCEQNGWTFLHLDRVDALKDALVFAEQYAPCVVFAEDIDRVLAERDDKANELINTLDGVLSKRAEVITVLTTNHVEKIQPVMLRPGRLDAVISLETPDADTVAKLIRVYGAGLVADETDLTAVSRLLSDAGQIPATVREVIERSKLAMINEGASAISGEALYTTARSMTNHLALLNRPRDEPSDAEKLYDSLKKMVVSAANLEDLVGDEDGISHYDINRNTDQEAENTRAAAAQAAKAVAAEVRKSTEKVMNKVDAAVDTLVEKIEDAA